MRLALQRGVLGHARTPPTAKQALQVFWDANIVRERRSLTHLHDEGQHGRLRPAFYGMLEQGKPVTASSHSY
eukprot:1857625-Pyramimonas_sp.AAC.1